MGTLDHIGINVTDYARSKAFYEKALAPLGIHVIMEYGTFCGFGRDGKPDFWIGQGATSYQKPEHLAPITPVHVSFVARNHAEVHAFHVAALEAGGRDFGPPGPRDIYHPGYYGAFVRDPDGNNVEACCHLPEA